MIPDIALMIVIYGAARLLVASMDPYRRTTGSGAQIATGLTWVVTVGAILGLAALGIEVLNTASSIPSLGG